MNQSSDIGRSSLPVLVLLLMTSALCANTLHVPADYSTVQAAFDHVQAGDTVSVALDVYAEALTAPALPFVLKGDVLPDTGDYPRPVIDPAALPGSDSLHCMTLPAGSAPVIEDIRFRNGPGMYPRHNYRTGGIVIAGVQATFRRCVFDSVYRGLSATTANVCSLSLDQCRFLKVESPTYGFPARLYIDAKDCLFSGSGWAHVTAYAGCSLLRCRFGQNWDGPMVWAMGQVSIVDCQFGPPFLGDSLELYAAVMLNNASGIVQDNVFTNLQLGQGFISVECACNDSTYLRISHNRFINSSVETPHAEGSTGIEEHCQMNSHGGCATEIDSNLFENNSGSDRSYRCLGIDLEAHGGPVIGNRFHNVTADTVGHPFPQPIVYIGDRSVVLIGRNRFDSTGLALQDDRRGVTDTIDARGNWWGDPSGPYQVAWNPLGRGDTIIGSNIDFSRWCRDTACTTFDAVPPFRNPHPSSFILSAFPNPFNSTTVLHLQVPQPEIVRVELYDVLGRKVKELWSGAVAEEKEIAVDGSGLASGVYFVRATNPIWNRPLVSTKIVLLK